MGKKPGIAKIGSGTPRPDDGAERETTMRYEAASSDDSEVRRTYPLVEIRELCDDDGGIVTSEVVDVSSAMRRLGEGLGDVASDDGAEGGGGGRRFGEILARTIRDAEADVTRDAHASSSSSYSHHHRTANGASSSGTTIDDDDDDDAEADEQPSPAPSRGPTSVEAYGELRSRLEELERLEMEDAESKMENKKSSVRLQSGGWSRGFLETKKKKKKTPPPPPPPPPPPSSTSSRRRGATEGHAKKGAEEGRGTGGGGGGIDDGGGALLLRRRRGDDDVGRIEARPSAGDRDDEGIILRRKRGQGDTAHRSDEGPAATELGAEALGIRDRPPPRRRRRRRPPRGPVRG